MTKFNNTCYVCQEFHQTDSHKYTDCKIKNELMRLQNVIRSLESELKEEKAKNDALRYIVALKS